MPSAAQAFAFAAPVIESHLDEPLRIHLPIRLHQGESLNQIFIRLATPDIYKQWGLQASVDVSQLHLQIHHEQENHPYVEIRSYQSMSTAWVSFILEAKQDKHYFYKQVQVMLDPASFSSSQANYTLHEKVVQLPATKAFSQPQRPHSQRQKPNHVDDVDWARTWRYGPVRSGDSLSTIAYRLRKDKRYSNHAIMQALYRLNPNAFAGGDINHLKAGVFLDVPHAKQLKTLLSTPIAPKSDTTPTVARVKPEKTSTTSKLHYIGHIVAQAAPSSTTHSTPPTPQTTAIMHDVKSMKERLDDMYKKSMASHIRMDGMDLALGKVNAKVGNLEKQVKQVNQNQLALQMQVDQLNETYDDPWLWRWGLLILLLLNATGLAFLYMRFRKKKEPTENNQTLLSASPSTATESPVEKQSKNLKRPLKIIFMILSEPSIIKIMIWHKVSWNVCTKGKRITHVYRH